MMHHTVKGTGHSSMADGLQKSAPRTVVAAAINMLRRPKVSAPETRDTTRRPQTSDAERQWREQGGKEEEERKWLQVKELSKDEFTFIKRLGSGYYGEVELVKKKQTSNLFAMKTLVRERGCADQEVVKRLTTEKMVLVEVSSVWVVRMFHSFQDALNHYLLLEYIVGGSLMDLIRREGNLTEEQARFYGAEMLMAINAVHRHGFMHRNLKPSNFLIDATGHLKVCDFGLAIRFLPLETCMKLAGESSFNKYGRPRMSYERRDRIQLYQRRAVGLVGSVEFMSPEMVRSEEKGFLSMFLVNSRKHYSFSTDFWSFGVCMYVMLFRQSPFRAKTVQEVKTKILTWRQTLQFPVVQPLSENAKDLLSGLLCNEQFRLGLYGCEDIMCHTFFDDIEWTELRDLPVGTPYEARRLHEIRPKKKTSAKPYANAPLLGALIRHVVDGGPSGYCGPVDEDKMAIVREEHFLVASDSGRSGNQKRSKGDNAVSRRGPSITRGYSVHRDSLSKQPTLRRTASNTGPPETGDREDLERPGSSDSIHQRTEGMSNVHEDTILSSVDIENHVMETRKPPYFDRSLAAKKFLESNKKCVVM